jgi:hypothetical protein
MVFRGRGGDDHHYAGVGAGNGTLMRHFLHQAFAPGTLPGGMEQGPAAARLEAGAGTAHRFAPTDPGAVTGAVLVAAVTIAADAHLRGAAAATVQSIGLLACRHAPRAQHWTKRRDTGIKARQPRPARARKEGPGFCQECARAFVYPASANRIPRERRRHGGSDSA